MKRPKLSDYISGVSQMCFNEKLNEYHDDLEKYADFLEKELNWFIQNKSS